MPRLLPTNNVYIGKKKVRPTVAPLFVWAQTVAISTCAMIGAACVNTLVCTSAIARLTLVDIWKGKIRQDKVKLFMNEPLTRSTILQKHNCISWKKHCLDNQASLNFVPNFQLVQLMAWCRPGDVLLLHQWNFFMLRQLVSMCYQCWMPGSA